MNLINEDSFDSGSSLFDGAITFDDAAAQVVNYDVNSPHSGTFRPIGSLADFNGSAAGGTWTLFIEDTVGADSLRFHSFALEVTTADGGVPEPGSLSLILLGGAAIAIGTLKRRLR